MLNAKDSVIARATKALHLLSSDPETVRLAELRKKVIWDEVSNINGDRAFLSSYRYFYWIVY